MKQKTVKLVNFWLFFENLATFLKNLTSLQKSARVKHFYLPGYNSVFHCGHQYRGIPPLAPSTASTTSTGVWLTGTSTATTILAARLQRFIIVFFFLFNIWLERRQFTFLKQLLSFSMRYLSFQHSYFFYCIY